MDLIDRYLAADKREKRERRSFTKLAQRVAKRKAQEASPGLRSIDRNRFEKYGVTPGQYAALLDAQGGVCDICGKAPIIRALCVDHDHETGKVRALLCSPCNLTLGQSRDPEWFRSAADYLERHAA